MEIKLPKDREIKILKENIEKEEGMITPRECPEFEVRSPKVFGDRMISFK